MPTSINSKHIISLLKQNRIARLLLLEPARRYRIAKGWIKQKSNFKQKRYGFPPVNTIFYVKPEEIIWHTNYRSNKGDDLRNRNFVTDKYYGAVVSGDWDTKTHKFTELAVYQAIEARIKYGTNWQDTRFFSECLKEIGSGKALWGCQNKSMLLERCLVIEQIINNMKKNGYKCGSESYLPHEDFNSLAKKAGYSEEITVNIGRDGDFFFQDGRHRLAIAKVLGIDSIPVKVLVRHELWCEKLLSLARGEVINGLMAHPDGRHVLTSKAPHEEA